MQSSHYATHLTHLNDQARLPTAANVLIIMAVAVTKWDHYWRTRKALSTLEPHILRDIGITASEAQCEAKKHFWQG